MKVAQSNIKFNFHLTSAQLAPKTVSACGHEIYRLNQKQNCHLLSAMCQQKCSLKQIKHSQPEQHQEFTEIELRKFMIRKIEHNNKAITTFKKQIEREIEIGEEMLKSMKDDLMKRIDMLFYGAVKCQNAEVTSQSMDKFLRSELETLTCHEVFCVFNFRPQISENLNLKISETLDSVKQQIIRLGKMIDNTRLSIAQKMIRSQVNLENSRQHIIEEEEDQTLSKVTKKHTVQKIPVLRMEPEIQPKNNFGKLRTQNSELQKRGIENQREQIQSKNIEISVQKQQIIQQKITMPMNGTSQQKKQQKKIESEIIKINKSQTNQDFIGHKHLKKPENQQIKQVVQPPNTKSKQGQSQLKDRNIALLEKCQMFQRHKSQQFIDSNKNKNQIQSKIVPEKYAQLKQKPNVEKINQNPKSKTSDPKQLSLFFQKFKQTGSLNRIFEDDKEKLSTSNQIQQAPEKKTIEKNSYNIFESISNENKQKQFLSQKQTKPGNEKTSVFLNLKRAAQNIKQKPANESRKIIKTGNDFPGVTKENNQQKVMQSNLTNVQKMIPQAQQKINQSKIVSEKKPIILQNLFKVQFTDKNSQKPEKDEQKNKPTDKQISPKEKVQSKPVLSGSDKLLIELVRQSSQTDIQQNHEIKKNSIFDNINQTKTIQKQHVASERDFMTALDDWHQNNLPKQTQKQSNLVKQPDLTHQKNKETKKSPPAEEGTKEEKNVNSKQIQTPKRSFLPKPSILNQSQPDLPKSPQQQSAVEAPKQSLQFGMTTKKIIRLQNPVSRPFGRVSANTIFEGFDRVQAFQRAEKAMKESQLKKDQYAKLSLLGQLQNSSNSNRPQFQLEKSQSENIKSERKFNFNGQQYKSSIPNWITPKEEEDDDEF